MRNLTKGRAWAYFPEWAQDATRIAFTSWGYPFVSIRVVDAKGTEIGTLRREQPGLDWRTSWAPDGKWIAFALDPNGHNYHQIYVMRADAAFAKAITRT